MEEENEIKMEYIKSIIENLESLKSLMKLFITFDIGLITLTLSAVIFSNFRADLSVDQKVVLLLSLTIVSISAFFYVIWLSYIQYLRNIATDWIYTLNIDQARRIHYPGETAFNKWGWLSVVAVTSMVLGIIGYLWFILLVLEIL